MDIKGIFDDLQMEVCRAKLHGLNNSEQTVNDLSDAVLTELSKVYKLIIELDNAVNGGGNYEWHIQEQ